MNSNNVNKRPSKKSTNNNSTNNSNKNKSSNSSNTTNNNVEVNKKTRKHKKLSESEAKKRPVGSFYHPTEKTVRTGNCPPGEIIRKGYYRHSFSKADGKRIRGRYIKETCVPNKGLPGKETEEAKVLPSLRKGQLTKYGYHIKEDSEKRFRALLKAMKEYGYAGVIRHLVPLRTYQKANPEYYAIVDSDIKRLQQWHANHPEQS